MELDPENDNLDNLEDAKAPDYAQIISDLFEPEKEIPVSAYYYLSDLPPEHLTRLKNDWLNLEERRRGTIARNLADIAESNFAVDFSPIAADFLKDPSDDVRLAALDMLWDTDKISLIDPIITLMKKDKAISVRASAAASLGHYLLMAQWGEIGLEVEEPIAQALIAQITNLMTPIPVRRAALESVASAPLPEVQTYIRDAYESGVPEMELSAIFAMGRSADAIWTPIIQNELENSETEVRAEAAKAAGIIGDSSFAEALAEMARYDDDLEVQIAAVHALGLIGNEIATNTLSEMAEEAEDDALIDAIEESLEDMAMIGLDLDLSIIDWDGQEDDAEGEDDLPL
ncbi:MAG: HEAT repeat domain-containing protein [Anaerolineae bacterium]